MSFRLTHAAGNMFAPTTKRHEMYSAIAHSDADVWTHSEAVKDHDYIRSLPGTCTLFNELAICWNPATFDVVETRAKLVMVGGKRGPLGSKGSHARRGPSRYALAAVLREKSTGQLWLIVTHHAIAKADTKFLWRRTLRNQGFRNTAAFVKVMRAKYPTALTVATGDWNTRRTVNLGLGLKEAKTPATFGRLLRYDRMQGDPDVRFSGIHASDTSLDHKAITATVSAMGATPSPAPAPKPPPIPAPPKPPEVHVPRQAKSLDVMLAEVNKHAPKRSKVSDGGLGDAAHASRESDHNPNSAGVWRARDVTNDPAGGMPGQVLSRLVAAKLGRHPALMSGAYVIFNHQIISCNRLSEGWRPYTGTNAHEHHVHISVSTAASGYDSTKPWDLFTLAVKPTPTTAYDEFYTAVENALRKYGAHVQAKYEARHALVTGIAALMKAAPVPASRKAKK